MKRTYHVSGMSCTGCQSHVTEALDALPQVQKVVVDLKEETATIETDEAMGLEVLQDALAGSLYQLHHESQPKEPKKLAPLPEIGKHQGTYYCPMQCEGDKTYNQPGDCPVCGMDLVLSATSSGSLSSSQDETYSKLVGKFKIALGFTLPIFLIAMSEMLPRNFLYELMPVGYWNIIQFALSIPVVFYATWMFFQRAYNSIITGNYNMFTLIGIGAGMAWLFSVFSLLLPGVLPEHFKNESGDVYLYFESATVILTLVLLGQLLEARAHNQTSGAIRSLLQLAPNKAFKVLGDKEIEIEIDKIQSGDVLRVKPGGKIPVDGKITEGRAIIDESMITGESLPVNKDSGDRVSAGTLNGPHTFTMIAQKVGKETLLAQIIEMVNEASRSRAPMQRLADKISAYFVPGVILVSLLTFVVWAFLGPEPRWVYALVNAIAVLIIACPCALGLATPMSVMVGIGKGATLGVLIKDAESLEKMAKVDVLIIDKTGTVTEGKPSVEQIIVEGEEEGRVIQWLASVNQLSEHPLAVATVSYALEKEIELIKVTNFELLTGRGVRANVEGGQVAVGNDQLMSELEISIPQKLMLLAGEQQSMGKTVSYIARDRRLVGMVVIADQLKETSRSAIETLQASGMEVMMLTGDHERTAKAVADQLGLKEWMAGCLPKDKMEKVREMKTGGQLVAMAGDGVNDAPALALSDVGIAMGTGTDVAIESAAITLVKGDLTGIAKARVLSEKVIRNIKQNLFFALIYNLIGVPIAAGIMYPLFGILLSPMIAALAMSFSSVSVISNALRLKSLAIH